MRRGNEYNIDQFLSSREITTFWKSFFGSCRHKSFRFDIGVLLHTSPNWLLKLIYISCCLCNPIRGSWVARHLIGGSSEMAWTPIGWVGRSRRPRVHGLIVASAGALSRSQYALLSLSLSLSFSLFLLLDLPLRASVSPKALLSSTHRPPARGGLPPQLRIKSTDTLVSCLQLRFHTFNSQPYVSQFHLALAQLKGWLDSIFIFAF